jgi:dTDP-glucose 4,6-dehydratase
LPLASQKILVTGADGFIGSHLVEALVHDGCNVRAFVLYNSFNSWGWLDHTGEEIKKNIDIFAGDIRDPHGVKKAMDGCDVVFHLAALIGIPYSYHSPDTYVETNVKGTLNIVQAARELEIERVIHTSTSEVYGTAKFVPITEEHPLQGQSPYSASKIGADHIAMSFYHAFGTPVCIARPFNTYGPRQSARAVIPTIITQLLSGDREIRLGSLTPTRDLNYVTDICRGFIALADCNEAVGKEINIGSGEEISIGSLARQMIDLINPEAKIIIDEIRIRPEKSEVQRLLCGNQRIASLTNWKPKVNLAEGLKKTIEWFQKAGHLDRYKANIYNI